MRYEWLRDRSRQFSLTSTAAMTVDAQGSAFACPEDTLRILYAVSGTCQIATGDRQETLIGERMLLLLGETAYSVRLPSPDLLLGQVDFSHMHCGDEAFSLYKMYQNYADYRAFCDALRPVCAFHDRFALVRCTVPSLSLYAAYEQNERKRLLSLSLSYLMQVITSALQDKVRQPYLYNRHVRSAIQYMHENYMRSITAEDIAGVVGIHTGHLHRLFRSEVGQRVTEYLIGLRLEKAKTLLKRTDVSIAAITDQIGLSSPQYLSRLFRQHVGMTPRAYRSSYNVTCDYEQAQGRYCVTVYNECARGGR